MQSFRSAWVLSLVGVVLLSAVVALVEAQEEYEHPQPPTLECSVDDVPRGSEIAKHLPLLFEKNHGQLPRAVKFHIRGADRNLFFTESGVTTQLVAPHDGGNALRTWSVAAEFVDVADNARIRGREPSQAVVSYFRGPRESWRRAASTCATIAYEDLWPGIDLVYRAGQGELKYELHVAPGADPGLIRFRYSGATGARVDTCGRLVLATPLGDIEDDAPIAFHEDGDSRTDVGVAFELNACTSRGGFELGFRVAAYDRARPLVIDPSVFVFSGFLGGARYDSGRDIAVDDLGYVYVVGSAESPEFPFVSGPGSGHASGSDAFITKLTPDGSAIVFSGFIGGRRDDAAESVAIDAEHNVYVSGWTRSDETTFPVVVGPDLTHNGDADAFVAKITPSGTELLYCGYHGGARFDYGGEIAVDGAGQVTVVGDTGSFDLPTVIGPDSRNGGGSRDGYVMRLSGDGTTLLYAGYIGGRGFDSAGGLALDDEGHAYICGSTEALEEVVLGPDVTYNGGMDAYVGKLAPDGSGFVYLGYIGGTGWDTSRSVTIDADGAAYVVGDTESDESTFPVRYGPDLTYNGLEDAFIAKVSPSGQCLEYAGYIGGGDQEFVWDVALEHSGHAYVTGSAKSTETTFPVRFGPDLTHNGDFDAFLVRIDPQGKLVLGGFVGGANDDSGRAVVIGSTGDVYVVGGTASDESTFPVVGGPDLEANGQADVFVLRFSRRAAGCRRGRVGVGNGSRADVVFVNDLPGDAHREVVVAVGERIEARMAAPPSGPNPAPFALYLYAQAPTSETITLQPQGLGHSCFPTFLTGGNPLPQIVWNNAGQPGRLGRADRSSNPAPSIVFSARSGSAMPVVATLQGIIADEGSAAVRPASLTNAVVIRVVD